MQLPARPHGVDGRMWITGIFVIRLPRILISLAVLLSTCRPQERHSLSIGSATGVSSSVSLGIRRRQQAACCLSSPEEGTSPAPGNTVPPAPVSPLLSYPR
jgi:hypothetical protein